MSDTTEQECACCGFDTDCIDGLCQPCNDFNNKMEKLHKQVLNRPVAEHPDVQRLIIQVETLSLMNKEFERILTISKPLSYLRKQVVELQILVNDLLADKERLIGQVETLKKFVQNVADAYATGGDPEYECEMCRGEIQYAAEQILKGESDAI